MICDRCRAVGQSGEGAFAHLGDLLDFDPVPRQPRVNGWDAEAQRAFVALVATTGSKHRAAMALGRAAFGVEQLLKDDRGGSFRLAVDRALAIAKANGAMKLATDVADAAARQAEAAAPSRRRGNTPHPDEQEMADEEKAELLDRILGKWLGKVEQERTARLAGEIVAADHYLRQLTFIEVCFSLLAGGPADAWMELGRRQHDGESLFAIAETPFTRILDAKRRELWAVMEEPDRPEHPPARFLVERSFFSTEPLEVVRGGDHRDPDLAEQAARHTQDAQSQVEWEAKARRAFEERRDSDASSNA